MKRPEALILAGPNGAGKTSASATLVPEGMVFLNSDVVVSQLLRDGRSAAGVDIAAGREVLRRLREVVASGESFCIETNLAGRGFAPWIARWRNSGYGVDLAFVALDSPELAVRRVAGRVAAGGHNVPEVVIRRRWAAGIRSLFDIYLPLVDGWAVFDNSRHRLHLVAQNQLNRPAPRVADQERWSMLLALAAGAGARSDIVRQ